MANQPTHDEIRIRAYEIYLSRGGDHGLEEQDWLQAERELVTELNPKAASAAAASTGIDAKQVTGTGRSPATTATAPAPSQRTESATRTTRDRS